MPSMSTSMEEILWKEEPRNGMTEGEVGSGEVPACALRLLVY